MTKLSTREFVLCPHCDSSQDFKIYDSINVTLNPDFKEKLLNGELTTFKCENCGYSVETAYLLLYHDMDKKLMIYLDPNSELCEEQLEESSMLPSMLDPSYQFRIVTTRNELVEKILIFEYNLDDLPLELLK